MTEGEGWKLNQQNSLPISPWCLALVPLSGGNESCLGDRDWSMHASETSNPQLAHRSPPGCQGWVKMGTAWHDVQPFPAALVGKMWDHRSITLSRQVFAN